MFSHIESSEAVHKGGGMILCVLTDNSDTKKGSLEPFLRISLNDNTLVQQVQESLQLISDEIRRWRGILEIPYRDYLLRNKSWELH
jgi:hypothetical protein